MNKYCIIICGRGGKTTIYQKQPHKYLDIDYFIWNQLNSNKIKELKIYLENNNLQKISQFYKNEMINNTLLRNDNRIILTHHPDNAICIPLRMVK